MAGAYLVQIVRQTWRARIVREVCSTGASSGGDAERVPGVQWKCDPLLHRKG
jgi:hypothetical protein